jgi:intracellular septation protein A
MKKKNIVILFLLFGTIFLFNSCATGGNTLQRVFPEELSITPDPANPFQGTWITTFMLDSYVHVIKDMKGEWYRYTRQSGTWVKQTSYTIVPNNDEFITSTNWQISVTNTSDGDILTVDKTIYKRYK